MRFIFFCLSILIHNAASVDVSLECFYSNSLETFLSTSYHLYTCEAENSFIVTERRTYVSSVSGDHDDGKKNADVNHLHIRETTLNYIPREISKFFPNLVNLFIYNSNLLRISSNDLQQFPKLKILRLTSNELEFLEPELFHYNPHLEWIRLWNNRLKFISDSTFIGLSNLQHLDLESNSCVNKQANGHSNVLQLINEAKTVCNDEVVKQRNDPVMLELEELRKDFSDYRKRCEALRSICMK